MRRLTEAILSLRYLFSKSDDHSERYIFLDFLHVAGIANLQCFDDVLDNWLFNFVKID